MRVLKVSSLLLEKSEHVSMTIFGSRFRARIFQEHYDAAGLFMVL